ADVDHRLSGPPAAAGDAPGHGGTDLEVVRLHGDAELAGVLVPRDDRVSQRWLSYFAWSASTTRGRTGSPSTSSTTSWRSARGWASASGVHACSGFGAASPASGALRRSTCSPTRAGSILSRHAAIPSGCATSGSPARGSS